MNISLLTASFPVDSLTYSEVLDLAVRVGEQEHTDYQNLLHLYASNQAVSTGFYILAYDDDSDRLIAAASAIDEIGFNTYEWSLLVDPLYRQLGIGDAIYTAMQQALEARNAAGDLALVMASSPYGRTFIEQKAYGYSFSEATLEAQSQPENVDCDVTLRRYVAGDDEGLSAILGDAFGDTLEESQQLIQYNLQRDETTIWVAEQHGQVVGTVTTTHQQDVVWITAFAVAKALQGKGIGRQILLQIKTYAFEQGINTLMLDVEIENDKALAVYERAGFTKLMQVDYFARL